MCYGHLNLPAGGGAAANSDLRFGLGGQLGCLLADGAEVEFSCAQVGEFIHMEELVRARFPEVGQFCLGEAFQAGLQGCGG